MSAEDPNLTYLDFISHVGEFLGYRWGPTQGDPEYTSRQLINIKQTVQLGLSMAYQPGPLPGEVTAHTWTWLTPVTSLSLPEGEFEVKMPSSFGGSVEGPVLWNDADGQRVSWAPLQPTNWSAIRQMRNNFPDRTGPPYTVAFEPLPHSGEDAGGPQRWKMIFDPTADADYTIQLAYRVTPWALSEARPYHFGGPDYSPMFLAACKAAAEIHRDNVRPGEGVQWPYWVDRLIAAVHLDRKSQPKMLGINGDSSDLRWRGLPSLADRRRLYGPLVTVSGLTPE